MTKRIFGGAFFSAFITVLLALIIVLGAVHSRNVRAFTEQIEEETELLSSALNGETESDLLTLANAERFTNRITLIAADGTVL